MAQVLQPGVHPLRSAAAEFAPAPSLEMVARERLLHVVVGLALIHIALAFAHLFKSTGHFSQLLAIKHTQWSPVPGLVMAIASAFFLFLLRLLVPRLPLRWAHPLGSFVSALLVLNALVWFTAGLRPEKTVPLAFAVFSAGCLIFTTQSLILVVVIALGGWLWLAVQAHFTDGWSYFGAMLGAACVLALTFHRLHLQTIKQMLRTGFDFSPARNPALIDDSVREYEERFRRWYEATFEGIAIHDKAIILEANQALATLLHCDASSLAGQNLLDWFTRASRDMIQESVLLGNFRPFQAVVRRPDNTELQVELFTKQLNYGGREVMVTAFRDITERQRAAAALSAEQQRLQMQYKRQAGLARLAVTIGEATEVVPVLDCIVETAARILPATYACLLVHETNGFAVAASNISLPQGTGFDPTSQFARITEWICENRESFVASDITRDDPFEVNKPVPLATAYIGVPLLDGDNVLGILYVLESSAPRHFQPDELDFINELAGRGSMALAKARLYTQLRAANQRLEKQSALLVVQNEQLTVAKALAEAASDAKSEFLAKISHELRTPMNGVLGMTDYLLTTELNTDQRESAETVRDSAERLLTEIDHILDFSRLERESFSPKKTAFSVRRLVRDLAAKAEAARGGKSIAIRAAVLETVPEQVLGDGEGLERSLWNVMENAIRFTERGEVSISASFDTGDDATKRINFVVRDTGRGISPGTRDRLFAPFAQADNSLARDHDGLGLGLAMTKRIVERMQGTIHVESTVGHGSAFSISVPVEPVNGVAVE